MIKVLVVNDSALMRKILSDMLSSDTEINVAGTAPNGRFALEKIKALGPDVVVMDIVMPEMDGIEALGKIMKEWPVPVVMFSACTKKDSRKIIEAMEKGAVDFVIKPEDRSIENIKDELLAKVKAAALASLQKFKTEKTRKHTFSSTSRKVIAIGASTGGPQTIELLLTQLPANTPAPILIVQHMPPLFTKTLAERLDSMCEVRVKEAEEGDLLSNGMVFIAPGGFHMTLVQERDGSERIRLNNDPPEQGVKPCVNKLFKSVADIFKDNTIGVVLTGMGRDGLEGARAIKDVNGTVLAEAEESCVIYGMPKEVIEHKLADEIVPIEKMAVALIQLLDI